MVFAMVLTSVFTGYLKAETPNLVSYQGLLTDNAGNPLAGTYSVTFTVYDAAAVGNSKWTETQSVTTDPRGLFSVMLGSVAPMSDTVFNGSARYLAIQVSGDPEMSPRTRIVSTPFAYRVHTVDGAAGGKITTKVSIGPGHLNTGDDAFIAGLGNTASGPQSAIGGGTENEVTGAAAVISGGRSNYAPGSFTAIGGGLDNEADGRSSVIAGGDSNRVTGAGYATSISGGRNNLVSDTGAVIGGGAHNVASGHLSVVAGGGSGNASFGNVASGPWSVVSGGVGNVADSYYTCVTGGYFNAALNIYSTVAGGFNDTANGLAAAILGGGYNRASGSHSTVAGGRSNTAAGKYSLATGYSSTAAGDYSFAAGRGAQALHPGCFVWHDSSTAPGWESFGANQFIVRATGGMYLTGSGVQLSFGAGPSVSIVRGTYYSDNSIVAWGKVTGGTGAVSTNEFGVTSVVRNSAGNYTVTLDASATSAANLIPIANAELDVAPNSAATMRFVTINQSAGDTFDVYITNGSFTPTDNDFVFMVTAR